ncbi:ABC transporter permease [Sorangium sp. So ce321]|uniref:ABC transporter permease n=1 Tax=Sorangium sp. So ce321 TaxID=3133300 RepID=UPI003F5F6F92
MIPISYNLRSLAVRRTTTIGSAIGLGLVVFVFASSMMLANSIRRTLGRSARDDVAMVLRKGSRSELPSGIEEQKVAAVLSSPEVAKRPDNTPDGVGEAVAVILLGKLGAEGISNVQVRGVPDDALAFRSTAKIVEGRPAQPGTDEVIVGKAIAGRFQGLRVGDTFDLRKNRPVRVVGVFEDGGSSYESEVWADLHTVSAAFGKQGTVSSIRVRLISANTLDSFAANIGQDRQLGLVVMRESEYYEKQSEVTSLFVTAMGTLIAVLTSLGAIIGAIITMYASVANRQREIGTLRALGFSRRSILLSFLIESSLLALLGGLLGVVASLSMGFVRFSIVNFATFAEIVFTAEPTLGILVRSLLLSVGMGLLGGLFPAVRAARMSPIEAMRG